MKPKSTPTNHMPQRARIFILNETIIRTSPTLACEIKLNESMILLQLDFWISITDNFYDGRYWTYQSVRDMQKKAFPFWSIATINRTINRLLAKGYIIEGNYNTHKYDKTRWFSLNVDKLSELSSIAIRKLETQVPHDAAQNDTRSNQNETRPAQIETTIPESTTENTTENKGPSDFYEKNLGPGQDVNEIEIEDSTRPNRVVGVGPRKRLKGKNLQAFELVADNLRNTNVSELERWCKNDSERVFAAYRETVKYKATHYKYFATVYDDIPKKTVQKTKGTVIDYEDVDAELYGGNH